MAAEGDVADGQSDFVADLGVTRLV